MKQKNSIKGDEPRSNFTSRTTRQKKNRIYLFDQLAEKERKRERCEEAGKQPRNDIKKKTRKKETYKKKNKKKRDV